MVSKGLSVFFIGLLLVLTTKAYARPKPKVIQMPFESISAAMDTTEKCVTDLAERILQSTLYFDLEPTSASEKPFLLDINNNEFEFAAKDSAGNKFTGWIMIDLTDESSTDPRTGVVSPRVYCEIAAPFVGGSAFVLWNQNGDKIVNVFQTSIVKNAIDATERAFEVIYFLWSVKDAGPFI